MISLPTVFIVGAGASHPYGFPIGSELRNLVIDPLRKVPVRDRVVRRAAHSSVIESLGLDDKYQVFVRALRSSGYSSVDQFLEKNSGFTDIGTLAIALALVPCEQPARLIPPAAPLKDHWYEVLVEMLEVGTPRYLRNRVTVVTYNYDRSLEAYLSLVIRNRLRGARSETVEKHVSHIPVIHLHGQLGDLRTRPYSDELDQIQLAAAGIKVIHAVNPRTPEFRAAHAALSGAKRIYFLGFGYNETNLTRLKVFNEEWPGGLVEDICIVRGTSLNMSEKQWVRACDLTKGNMPYAPRYRQRVTVFLRDSVDVA